MLLKVTKFRTGQRGKQINCLVILFYKGNISLVQNLYISQSLKVTDCLEGEIMPMWFQVFSVLFCVLKFDIKAKINPNLIKIATQS